MVNLTEKIALLKDKIRHIVFDFDGVIADTETVRFNVLSRLLSEHGIDLLNTCRLSDLAGIPTDIFLTNRFPFLSRQTIEDIVLRRRTEYLNNLESQCVVFPGSIKTIRDLKNAGYALHIVTTNDDDILIRLLRHIGLEDAFETCLSRSYILNMQTKKKDYRLFLPRVRIDDPSAIAVIEDSITGIKSAKESGIFCIAFNIFNDPWISTCADISVGSYGELRKLFGL